MLGLKMSVLYAGCCEVSLGGGESCSRYSLPLPLSLFKPYSPYWRDGPGLASPETYAEYILAKAELLIVQEKTILCIFTVKGGGGRGKANPSLSISVLSEFLPTTCTITPGCSSI
jgi:hypothetical protein